MSKDAVFLNTPGEPTKNVKPTLKSDEIRLQLQLHALTSMRMGLN